MAIAVKSFIRDDAEFLLRNEWIKFRNFEFYLRDSRYDKDRMAHSLFSMLPGFSDREDLRVLEVANAHIKNRMLRNGITKRFLSICERQATSCGYDAVLVERPPAILMPYLSKQGYMTLAENCFAKPCKRVSGFRKLFFVLRTQADVCFSLWGLLPCTLSIFLEIRNK